MAKLPGITNEQMGRWANQIAQGQKSAAPVGGGGSSPAPDWQKLLNQSYANPQTTVDNSQKAASQTLGKQGLQVSSLDKKTQQALRNIGNADAQSVTLGAKRKQDKSWWEKGLDVISRPLYAVAEGTKEGIDKRGSGGGVFDTFGALGHGLQQGIEGKKKTTFEDVIQHTADAVKAGHEGRTPTQAVQGEAKVNPWLKYGAGLPADIFLDPTTYTGVGLLSKGLKAKEAVKALEESGKAVTELQKGGMAASHAHDLVASHLAPVENLSKKTLKGLSPEAQAVAAKAVEHQAEIGRKGLKALRKDKGAGTVYLGTKVGDTGKTVKDLLASTDKTGKLTETMLKNASPDVTKQLALRFGKSQLAIPGVAAGAGKIGSKLAETRSVALATKHFNDAFRAKAGINAALHGMRNSAMGVSGQNLIHYAKNLRGIYDKTPESVRKGLMSSYRKGAVEGNSLMGGKNLFTGEPTTHLMSHFQSEVKRISQNVDNMGVLPEELNGYLPKAYRSNPLRAAGVSKSGQRVYTDTERKDWLVHHIKTSEAFTDPAKALHFFNAATNQIAAKRAMEHTIGKSFGVSKTVSTGVGGKEILHHTEQTKMLQSKGWREAKGIPELKGTLLHPDVAHGVERMHEVFKSRESVDGLAAAVQKATTSIKSLMTIYNPGFHPRTMIGEVLLTYLGGVPLHQIPRFYGVAAKIMHGRDRELLGHAAENLGGAKLSRSQVTSANILHNSPTSIDKAAAVGGSSPAIKTKFGMLSDDQIWHAFLNSGVKSGFASTELIKSGADKGLLPGALRKANEGVHKSSEIVEDTGRLAHFSYLLSTSKARTLDEAVKDAASETMKYHLDYSATTRTENKISSYGVPFYKWLRLSTPLMVDILMHNPGKILNVPKSLSAISKASGYDEGQGQGLFPASPDVMTPSFLSQHGAYPMFGKNTHYYDPTSLFPVAGSVDLLNSSIIDKVNPLISYPWRSAERLAPNSNAAQDMGKPTKQQSWPAFLSGIVPQTKLAYNEATPPDPNIDRLERLLMFMGNPGFVSNTPKKIKGEVYKQRDASYKNRKVRKKQLGLK